MERIHVLYCFLFMIAIIISLVVASDLESSKAKKPHLIILLADDYGWGNIGYHRTDNTKEVQTPNLDAFAASGVIFDRFYVYKICSPSRSSLQSGRLPVHVNTVNAAPEVHNPNDPISGYAGIPRNMTCIAEKLKREGYRTVMTGKWDAGMAIPRLTPLGRGFDSFLGYFHHANDYNTCGLPITATGEINRCGNQFLDLWKNDRPAHNMPGTAYEEELFERHSLEAINGHDSTKGPLFLFHSFHLIHTPLQVPEDVLSLFGFIDYMNRRKYAAMVYYMDRTVGRLIDGLKAKGMYEDSLVLFFSDNGGPVYNPGSANNWPLRGGKYADFE
jgi:arylsulfatase B